MKGYIIPLYYAGWAVMGGACGFWAPFFAALGVGMLFHACIGFMAFVIGED